MKNYKLHTSEGFNDTFGITMLIKEHIGNVCLKTFKSFGYEYIKTPTVEYIDVYLQNGAQKPNLYNLINHQGEVLALCNDMTSSIARYVSASNINEASKYCYLADTFRYPRLYQGKKHEFTQAGVEYVGGKGLNADAEIIYLANKVLKELNINDFTIHIGSALFLDQLFKDFNLSDEQIINIYSIIENKNYVELETYLLNSLSEEDAKFIFEIILKGGRLNYIEKLINNLSNKKSCDELKYLKDVYSLLKQFNVENIIFDFSIFPYANYYSGLIFEIYVDEAKKSVATGGRCDIFKHFDKNLTDIGFGIDVDVLTTYCLEHNLFSFKKSKYLSFVNDDSFEFANKTNEEFRNKDIIVNNLEFESLEDALKFAKENEYDKVISYSNNSFKLLEV